ncbi:MAG: hypothetical protein Q9218_007291 [Villophora microphyllina]
MAVAATAGTSQPAPTATLANMTSGTTFAQKARAAELNAVLARRAAKENAEKTSDSSMTSTSLGEGALKLTKPRNSGRNWKKLNLDEIPETATETKQPETHQTSTTRSSTLSSSDLEPRFVFPNLPQSPQHVYPHVQQVHPSVNIPSHTYNVPYYGQEYQGVTAIPQFTSGLLAQNPYFSPEHFRQQMMHYNQMNQLAAQHNAQYLQSCASTLPAEFQSSTTYSPEQLSRRTTVTADDPFVDMPQTALRQNFPSTEHQYQQSTHSSLESALATPSARGSSNHYERKASAEHQQPRTILPPPGFSNRSAYLPAASGGHNIVPTRQPVPASEIHQRDPKPYTSFARSTFDISKNDELLQHLQQVAQAEANTSSSNRTVLYDAVARDISETSGVHRPGASRSGSDILQTSEPLPWKDRPVDIYNMAPPATTATSHDSHQQGEATTPRNTGFQGNAYIQSLVPREQSLGQRLNETEAWWRHDGRGGQEAVRAYLETVAEEHRKKKAGRDYESIKRELERQASFRDEWSDTSHSTTMPEASKANDITDHLLAPVLANLRSYKDPTNQSYFNKFTQAPAWAVDNSPSGNNSFFGEDWGKPPSRVGRDPRYRPTYHEGRYTVFEPNDGRVSGRGW